MAFRTRRLGAAGSIDVAEDGIQHVSQLLGRITERARDKATVQLAEEPVNEAIKRLFANAGNGRWRPTSDETRAEKARKGLRTEPMRATDTLYRALTQTGAANRRVTITQRRNITMTISAKVIEGAIQRAVGRDASLIDDRARQEITEAILRRLVSR